MVIGAIVLYAGYRGMSRAPAPNLDTADFAARVDLEPLNRTAVHADGRLRSFESHAKTFMGYVTGPRRIDGHTNGFTYLDLMFRPQLYADVDLVYVKNKLVREQLLDVLKSHPNLTPERAESIRKSGLMSRLLLNNPAAMELMHKLGQDLIRSSKAIDAVQSALTVSNAAFLGDQLRLVPPPTGDVNQPWLSPGDLSGGRGAPTDDMHAGLSTLRPIEGLDPGVQKELADQWTALRTAWNGENAEAVNAAIAKIAFIAPTIAPAIYPTPGRLSMESWYFRTKSMTWVWLVYLLSVAPLLMAVIYHWTWARRVGMAMFTLAFLLQTASLGVRWYISGRWPNANMFEAVTTAAWMGGVLAIVLEWIVRRTLFRNLFALGSAVMSMAALMAAYFLPAQLDSAINNKMAALNDVWLYIHTNVIIWSYAIIGLACIPALLLLRHRWCNLWDEGSVPRARLLMLPAALAVLNYTSYLLLMHFIDYAHRGLSGSTLVATLGAMWASFMVVVLELLAARARRRMGATFERGASGGASALMGPGGGAAFLTQAKPTATQIYDGATMVLVELSFIMLWAGIVMGAIWADHSWGRPWGWDPKEVFALNTFFIFLVLIHIRLKVRDKGFWTAVLAVIGFEVMMFNWIVVNFIISGLHSYA